MIDLEKLQLAYNLVYKPELRDFELIELINIEFDMNVSQEDLNTLKASRLPDNFDVESRKIEYYG